MNKKYKQALKGAFSPPTPKKKEEFLKTLRYPKASKLELFVTQFGYIRKRFWVLSILMMAVIFGFMHLYTSKMLPIGIVSSIIPFLSLLGVSEIQRSASHNMAEMEIACRHNLGQVTLIRLIIIGVFNFFLLTLFLIVAIKWSEYNLVRTALYVTLPFLLCTFLSLYISNRMHSRDVLYICGAVTGFISIVMGFVTERYEIIYAQKHLILWIGAFVILSLLFASEIRKTIKRTEDLEWNLQLTA